MDQGHERGNRAGHYRAVCAGDEAQQTQAAEHFIEKGAYKRSAASVASAVDMLLNHKDLVLQDSEVVAAALEIYRSRPALGFSDGTFDRTLGRVEGAQKL